MAAWKTCAALAMEEKNIRVKTPFLIVVYKSDPFMIYLNQPLPGQATSIGTNRREDQPYH